MYLRPERTMTTVDQYKKSSKKIGCNAIIMVTCRISDRNIVEFTRKNDHNHIPGSYSDLQHMSISDTLQDDQKFLV
jgi:hypothetical protein